MSYTENPHYPKNGTDTTFAPSPGAKRVKMQMLRIGQTPDIGKAPPSRIYTRDYCKVYETADTDNVDLVGPALGNPLRL